MAIDKFEGEYRWLSNFWPAQVRFEDIVYPSVEHAYQAAKSMDPTERWLIQSVDVKKAKQLGKKIKLLRPNWDIVKFDIMRNLIAQKFVGGTELGKQLVRTGDEELIEGNWWGDRIWGVCKGIGENHLGKILMERRKELQS